MISALNNRIFPDMTVFGTYPNTAWYLEYRYDLTEGMRMGLTEDHPSRVSNNNPAFSISKKICIAQQVENG